MINKCSLSRLQDLYGIGHNMNEIELFRVTRKYLTLVDM